MTNVEKPKNWPYFLRKDEIEWSQRDSTRPLIAGYNPVGSERFSTLNVGTLPKPFFEERLLSEQHVEFSRLHQQINRYYSEIDDITIDKVGTMKAMLETEENLQLLDDALVDSIESIVLHIVGKKPEDERCPSCAKLFFKELNARGRLYSDLIRNPTTFLSLRPFVEYVATLNDMKDGQEQGIIEPSRYDEPTLPGVDADDGKV